MPYTVGISNAKKRNLRVFARSTSPTPRNEIPATWNELYGMANYLAYTDLTDTSDYTTADYISDPTDFQKTNNIIDVTILDNQIIDLADLTMGADDDLYVLRVSVNAVNKGLTVIDESDVSITLLTVGEFAMLRRESGKWEHFVHTYIYDSVVRTLASAQLTYQEIGACEVNPNMTGSEGDSTNINWGDNITTSEKIDLMVKDLEVTKANYEYLRLMRANSEGIDFMFLDLEDPTFAQITREIKLKALPDVTGNNLNTVSLSGSKDCKNLDDYFDIYSLTS